MNKYTTFLHTGINYLCMMKVLIVSATKDEVTLPVTHHLVSGVGMVSTAISVTKALTSSYYDLVINVGIAGSFTSSLKIGDVVEVNEDYLSELGAEDGNRFLTPNEIGLMVNNKITMPVKTHLPKVRGITVNTVHGNDLSIVKIVHRLQPHIESMEGAACMMACYDANVPCIQIRAISNYVEKRNKSNWNIPFAVEQLNAALKSFMSTL